MRARRAPSRAPLLRWMAPDFTARSIRDVSRRSSSSARPASPLSTADCSLRNHVLTCDTASAILELPAPPGGFAFLCEAMLAIYVSTPRPQGGAAGAQCVAPRFVATGALERRGHGRWLERNTAFSSFATGLSRLLGLVSRGRCRELLRVTGAHVRVHHRVRVPNLVARCSPTRRCRVPSCPYHRAARARGASGGLPGRLEPLLPDPRAGGAHPAVRRLAGARPPARAGVRPRAPASPIDGLVA